MSDDLEDYIKRTAQQKRYEQALDIILESFLIGLVAWVIFKALGVL